MNLIKRIILWIIAFIKRIFGKSDHEYNKSFINHKNISYSKQRIKEVNFNETLPSYMMISDENKDNLINRVVSLKNKLSKIDYKEIEIKAIDEILNNIGNSVGEEEAVSVHNYIKNTSIDKISPNKLKNYLSSFDDEDKNKILIVVDSIKNQYEKSKAIINGLDDIVEYTKKNEISYMGMDVINKEIERDNNVDNYDYDKNIIEQIKTWDKEIIKEIKNEYQKVNYVTISTVSIDKMVDKYKKIEESYKNHRYNKAYYDKEINKLKSQIYYLCDIKNKKVVFEEIQRLRKDLYTKSKDKYDILYNNEIFMDIEKKCDDLLNKVNQRVIDIKNEQKNEQKEKIKNQVKEQKNKKYVDNIILRFQDLELSSEIILNTQNEKEEPKDSVSYINNAYNMFINGFTESFNFEKNRIKTELVVLYNNLNTVISMNKKESFTKIAHINFRIEDLIEAVIVRMNEINAFVDINKIENINLVQEKIEEIKHMYLKKDKVLTKIKKDLN